MSLETWVGLMRNGLCVVSDTMPDRFDQLGRYASLNGMSTMNLLIAPLQVAAVVFNVPGALGLPGAVAAWAKSGGVDAAAAKSGSAVAVSAAARRREAATISLAFAFLKCTLAPAFLVLAANSCKKAEGWMVEYALLAMQVGLGVALWAMRKDMVAKRARAKSCEAVANATDAADGVACCETLCDAGLLEGDLASCVLGDGDESPDDPSDLKRRGDALAAKAKELISDNKKSKTAKAGLEAFAAKTSGDCDLDMQVWVLNVVAFCGYAVFPLTYFGPFARDPFHEWFGNFAGDLARSPAPKPVECPH